LTLSVKRRYRVDEDRISVRGFSMGGASAWHFAVHYPDRWFAANPGAGFSETPDFLKVFQKENLQPTWWERKLWQWYDCPGWAANLRQCPVVAYSGELDSQKQAADIMEPAMRKEGIELRHVIGPGTRHSIHPDGKEEVERRMLALSRLVSEGPRDTFARHTFTTPTLRFNRAYPIVIDELEEQWKSARIVVQGITEGMIAFDVEGVSAFTIDWTPQDAPNESKLAVAQFPGLIEKEDVARSDGSTIGFVTLSAKSTAFKARSTTPSSTPSSSSAPPGKPGTRWPASGAKQS